MRQSDIFQITHSSQVDKGVKREGNTEAPFTCVCQCPCPVVYKWSPCDRHRLSPRGEELYPTLTEL